MEKGMALLGWLESKDSVLTPATEWARATEQELAVGALTTGEAFVRSRAVLLQTCWELSEMRIRIRDYLPELERDARDFLLECLRDVEKRIDQHGDADGLLSLLRGKWRDELEKLSEICGVLETADQQLAGQMRRIGWLDEALALEERAGIANRDSVQILPLMEARLHGILLGVEAEATRGGVP